MRSSSRGRERENGCCNPASPQQVLQQVPQQARKQENKEASKQHSTHAADQRTLQGGSAFAMQCECVRASECEERVKGALLGTRHRLAAYAHCTPQRNPRQHVCAHGLLVRRGCGSVAARTSPGANPMPWHALRCGPRAGRDSLAQPLNSDPPALREQPSTFSGGDALVHRKGVELRSGSRAPRGLRQSIIGYCGYCKATGWVL